MPETQEAAGEARHQAAAATCGGGAPQGLDTIALTPVAVGEAAPAVTHGEEPVVRAGDAMRLAAAIVPDVRRASQGCRGGDDPLFGLELSVQLGKALREGHGAGGACLGPRRAARAAQDGAQGPHRQAAAGSSREPARPVGGQRPSRNDAVDMDVRPSGLIPGVHDPGAPALPAEVAVSKLAEGVTAYAPG
jgi:hypothetical protein